MAGRMHLLGHTRHPGMPTSGRYVYRPRTSDMQSISDVWYWQCDLHDDDVAQPDQYGDGATMREAFAGALAHAKVCSARVRDNHTHDSRVSRDACGAGHCDHATIVQLNGEPVIRSTDPVEYNRRVHLGLEPSEPEPAP
jgi:hypothetical protein